MPPVLEMAGTKVDGESELLAALSNIASAGALPGTVLARLARAVSALCHAQSVEFGQIRRRMGRQSKAIDELRSQLREQVEAQKAAAPPAMHSAIPLTASIELRRVPDAGFPRVAPGRTPSRKTPWETPPRKASTSAKKKVARGVCFWNDSPDKSPRPATSVVRVSRRLSQRSLARKRKSPGRGMGRSPGREGDVLTDANGRTKMQTAATPPRGKPGPSAKRRKNAFDGDVEMLSSSERPPAKRRKEQHATTPPAATDFSFLTRRASNSTKRRPAPPVHRQTNTSPARLNPLPSLDDVRHAARLRRKSRQAQARLLDRDNRPPCAECCAAQRTVLTDANGVLNEKVYARYVSRPGGCHHFRHLDAPLPARERDGFYDVEFPETETEPLPSPVDENTPEQENSP